MAITLNISYGAGVPTAAQNVVAQVANYFASQFTDTVTLNFTVNWGAIGGLGASSYSLFTYTYDQIKTALTSDSKTSDDSTTVASLPSTDPISGTHSWTMVRAEAKALGLIAGNATGSDGSMTFSNTAAFDFDNSDGVTAGQYDFYGVVAHEITELMGREVNAIGNNVATGPGYHPLDLFKYSGTGAHVYVGTTPGYFSVNNGTTSLANFNTNPNGDFGDWASGINDSFLAFSNSGVVNPVSSFDLRVMDVIGWDRVSSPPPDDFPANTTTSGVVSVGGFATGNLETLSDHDWFRVQLIAGVQYTLQELGETGGFGTLHDPLMTLYNSAGQFITQNDDAPGSLNSTIVYTPTVTGAYYIDAGAYNNQYTGTYRVSVDGPLPTAFAVDRFGDFNGGGTDDFLWRNADGSVGIWQMSNGSATPLNVGSAPPDWHIEGTGDFNGDGRSDILWRNDSGLVGEWQMNGAAFTPLNSGSAGADWHIAGAADFNGDGRSDILWRNDSGLVGIWQMNGTAATPLNIGSAGPEWHIVGTGDFNADGRNDILWRSDSGLVGAWLLNGAAFTPVNFGSAGPDWHIFGTADFNGDGRTDILWRNDSGLVGEWQMNAGGGVAPLNIGTAGADWHIQATGDVNGDLRDDIIWRNDSGLIGEWLMNGAAFTPQNLPSVAAAWAIGGHHFDLV